MPLNPQGCSGPTRERGPHSTQPDQEEPKGLSAGPGCDPLRPFVSSSPLTPRRTAPTQHPGCSSGPPPQDWVGPSGHRQARLSTGRMRDRRGWLPGLRGRVASLPPSQAKDPHGDSGTRGGKTPMAQGHLRLHHRQTHPWAARGGCGSAPRLESDPRPPRSSSLQSSGAVAGPSCPIRRCGMGRVPPSALQG